MAVITISTELGCGGHDIGRQVAQALGYEFVDRRTVDGIFRQYGLPRFEDVYDAAPTVLDLLNSNNLLIVSLLNEIVEALAQRGNIVILGRAGFAILGAYADVLNVRIQAPFAGRVQRVMARQGLTDRQAAEQLVREDDNVHRRYVQFFYNQQWDEPANFALVLDMGTLSLAGAVQEIVAAARALESREPAAAAATAAGIPVDPVLADAVEHVLANPLPELPA